MRAVGRDESPDSDTDTRMPQRRVSSPHIHIHKGRSAALNKIYDFDARLWQFKLKWVRPSRAGEATSQTNQNPGGDMDIDLRRRMGATGGNLMAKKVESQKLNTKLGAQIDNAGLSGSNSISILTTHPWPFGEIYIYTMYNAKNWHGSRTIWKIMACSASSAERRSGCGLGGRLRIGGSVPHLDPHPETAKTRTTWGGSTAAIKSFCERKMALDNVLKPPTSHCCLPSGHGQHSRRSIKNCKHFHANQEKLHSNSGDFRITLNWKCENRAVGFLCSSVVLWLWHNKNNVNAKVFNRAKLQSYLKYFSLFNNDLNFGAI